MNQRSYSFLGALLLGGMSLGTAWAIRGQFGHEQGAAWAGAIGCMAVILLARQTNWYPKAIRATLAGAIGWGLGGLMSYGLVVGYGRGSDFPNVFYGFAMLFVIGGLYGFLGGGLFGLVLEESEEKPIAWHLLLIEMVVLAIVTYFFMIEEWGWNMTPPRSEMWAACLGMALALAWFQVRHGYHSALRVALYAGLGAGFGFAFGNFLQVMGHVSEIEFNFWNVMEYSLGFFGGVGMVYGTFTAQWRVGEARASSRRSWFGIAMLALFIPLVVWEQSFGTERILKILDPLTDLDAVSVTRFTQLAAILAILGGGIYWLNSFCFTKSTIQPGYPQLRSFFLAHFGLYILCSYLITGALLSTYRIEQYLYLVNLVLIGVFINKTQVALFPKRAYNWRWGVMVVGVLVTIALLALVAVSSHGELKGMQVRF